MTTYAERLASRTDLLARLIRKIVEEKSSSYSKLAAEIGVTRVILKSFSGTDDGAPGKYGHSSAKIETLRKILEWFESTDFSPNVYTEEQKHIIEEIYQTFQHEHSDEIFGHLADGFHLNPAELDNLQFRIQGHFLALRRRGKTPKIQVSGMRFYSDERSPYFRWTMLFYQGDCDADDAQVKPHRKQGLVVVDGYVTFEEGVITCLGRRKSSNEVFMLNIMYDKNRNNQDYYRAMFSSYSRKEAIGRTMILVRQDDIKISDHFEILERIDDVNIDRFDSFVKDKDFESRDLEKRISVAWDEFKSQETAE